ncbi:MAG TPA: glycerophosphodiester phosphodiesterase family protein [Gemmatimonas sp.]|nr:glycerophosphodiester phosphodiesterase family protein [Gemmatimonas sp.]
MLVSAHRGGPGPGFPDNALSTFERAVGFGPMLIELDVRRTADGQLVILHDEDVGLRTNGAGRAGTLSLDSLQRLRLRDDNGTLTASRVPSLVEALTWARGRAVLRLDVKSGVSPADIVATLAAEQAFDRTMAIARSIEEVEVYHRLAPELMLSVWFDPDRNGRLSPDELPRLLVLPIDRRRVVVGVGSVRDGWDRGVLDSLRAHGIRGMVSTFGAVDSLALATGAWQPYCQFVSARVGVLITDAAEAVARAARDCR